jgi:hypothetical protein
MQCDYLIILYCIGFKRCILCALLDDKNGSKKGGSQVSFYQAICMALRAVHLDTTTLSQGEIYCTEKGYQYE